MSHIEVTLTVVETGSVHAIEGLRKTRDEKYHYKFDPEIVNVTECNTTVRYQLAKECSQKGYTVANLYATPNTQLSEPTVGECGSYIEVTHSNKHQCLLSVLVTVNDSEKGLAQCDPQMTNDPPPGGF